MARFWVGPWVWSSDQVLPGWKAPAGALASLDLRSVPQCAATVIPQGMGLFVTANATDLGSDYQNLGSAGAPQAITLGPAARTLWQSTFGLASAPSGPSLAQVVYEHVTALSDPTGDDRVCPLVPTMALTFEVWLAGVLTGSAQFRIGGGETPPLLDLLRRNYRAIRQACLNGDLPQGFYKKVLGFWARVKFRIAYQNFIPGDLPDEGDLPPETTITDDFNRTDSSTTLGTASGGFSWANVNSAVWGISTNRCYKVDGSSSDQDRAARAESDLSSADHYSQIVLKVLGGTDPQIGPVTRMSSSGLNGYVGISHVGGGGIQNAYVFKWVSGTFTDLSSGGFTGQPAWTAGDLLKMTSNGSAQTFNRTGSATVQYGPYTDTSLTTQTRTGLYGLNIGGGNSAIGDDFQAADLAAPAAVAYGFDPVVPQALPHHRTKLIAY